MPDGFNGNGRVVPCRCVSPMANAFSDQNPTFKLNHRFRDLSLLL